MSHPDLLKRRVERERLARKQAEAILEGKALELYYANNELRTLNENLEHKVAQRTAELRASEEKYRGIIENMELGLMEVDNEGIIVRAYPRFCEMVGYHENELIGRDAIAVFIPDDFLPVMHQQSQDRANGQAGIYEIQLRKKNGEYIWVLISGSLIYDLNGAIIGSVGIHYNVTNQKKMQGDLEIAKKQAEHAEQAQKQFLANMSHEIRTPLNAILGMSHLLYDTQPSDEQYEYLDILKKSAEMLRDLISDVLDLSKIKSGKLEIQEKTFDLVGLVRSLVKSYQLRITDKPLKIELHIDERLQNLIIGDDLLLNQILNNLIGNANKFTAKGIIKVTVKIKSYKLDRLILEFKVSDTGIGIEDAKQELIFQAFQQVDGDIKRKYGGTGLGLAIVKQLIEMQGGTILLKSRLGKGSTFTFKLPYKDSGQKIEISPIENLNYKSLNISDKSILVVEDNAMNRKYIATLLEKWHIPFTIVNDGRQGFELAQTKRFDLILMDIQMPEMDGYEATIAIRQSANLNTQTPIVALTASALISQKDKAFLAGFSDYVSKPFRVDQLLEKIKKYCVVENLDNFSEVENLFIFNPRLDANSLKELYGDDCENVSEIFGTFLNYNPIEWQELKVAFQNKSWDNVTRLAHKLKPTFGMVGLVDIEKMMHQLENASKSNPQIRRITAIIKKIEMELPEAIGAVRSDFERLNSIIKN